MLVGDELNRASQASIAVVLAFAAKWPPGADDRQTTCCVSRRHCQCNVLHTILSKLTVLYLITFKKYVSMNEIKFTTNGGDNTGGSLVGRWFYIDDHV